MSNVKIQHRAWGIGLGRTGTTTLCDALKVLGYRNVVHNPKFEELRDLDGAADNGCTVFYKYLDYKFPDSKFILTVRDLDPWLESSNYIHDRCSATRENDVPIMRRMLLYEAVAFDREIFTAAYHRHHADVKRYFQQRPDDLLVLNIMGGDGWELLCPFLELPIPDEPFPHSNARESGKQKRRPGKEPRPTSLLGKLTRQLRKARPH